MSYIQGTQVRVTAYFEDVETGEPITDMDDVILTVEDPNGQLTQYRRTTGEVLPLPVQSLGGKPIGGDGWFYYVINTAPAAGMWNYQFECTGPDAVVGRKQITVKQRIPAP